MPDGLDWEGFSLSGLIKGVPGGIAPFALRDIAKKGWNLLREDLALPAAVLKTSALDHNDAWMQSFLKLSGAVISPHGKTTMSPALFRRQLEHGAWAMTVATAQQIQVCREMGVNRIVLANQLIGRQAIRYVLDEVAAHGDLELYCLADSVAGVTQLVRALGVARAIAQAGPSLRLRGVEGFEGLINVKTPEETEARVRAFLDFLGSIAEACVKENLFALGPIILSAGGSAFYDLVVERFSRERLGRESLVLTRSGCYLTHDSGMYRRIFQRLNERTPAVGQLGQGLQPALEVWTYVQSRPELGLAICTMGRRDVSSD